jgi:hypothetical protein
MFLFWHLVLAHFIGDTILQPDEVYEIKKNRFAGVVLHAVIIFFTLLIFAWPYLHRWQVWPCIFLAAIAHLWQDELKIRSVIKPKNSFIFFMADQFLHLLFLTPILLISGINGPISGQGIFVSLYNNMTLTYYGITFVVVIFLGAYIWEAFRVSYFKAHVSVNPNVIKYGMFERALLLASLASGALWFLLVPVGFRIFYRQARLSRSVLFNILMALSGAWILRNFPPLF